MDIWQIGNEEPFKLTPASAKKLIEAIIETESRVISITKDTTCPPTYICGRFYVDKKKKEKFEELLGKPLECYDDITGGV